MVNKWGKPGLWRHADGCFYVVKTVGGKKNYLGPIKAPIGTEDFDREYWAIRTGKAAVAKRSWRALIKSYRASDRWTGLKPRTRADYELVLVYIEEKNGDRDATRVTRADAVKAMEANRHRVRFANYIAQVMSILVEHAKDIGWMRDNPIAGVRLLKMPEGKRQPHIPWTDAAVAQARADMGPLPRLILELGIGTVQRPGDLPDFTWGDFDGASLTLRQNKTDKPLILPCTEALLAELCRHRAALDFAPHPSRHILTNQAGARLTYRAMARLFLAERKRLGLMTYDIHALRYRGVMELAWHGCDDDEIAAYSGHMSKDMIRKYAGEARQVMRARQAKGKRR